MGTLDKLERKARRNPGGVRIGELVHLAESAGFAVTRTTAGHYVLVHPGLRATVGVAEPHGGGDSFLKVSYVRKVLSAIDDLRAGEAAAEE